MRYRLSILIISVMVCITSPIFGQIFQNKSKKEDKKVFKISPIPKGMDTEVQILAEKIAARLDKDLEELPKDFQDDLRDIYTHRADNIRQNLFEGHYITDKENSINRYIQTIFAEICKANPEIPASDIRMLTTCYNVPNAACRGEGTLEINVGLLRFLENESQIAFIMCHEISHYLLNHVNVTVLKKLKLLGSEKTLAAIEKIKQSEFLRRKKLNDLFKGYIYEENRHSREHELQADSLAFVLLSRTPYNRQGAFSALAILDSVDRVSDSLDIKERLNFPDYPFRQNWLTNQDLIKFKGKNNNTWNTDSLKTHPDCPMRISILKENESTLNEQKAANNFVQTVEQFAGIRYEADRRLVDSEIFFGNYGKALYHALLMTQKYPKDTYFGGQVSHLFGLLYQAQKKHSLGKYVSQISDDYPSDYCHLLMVIHNARLSELKEISEHFLTQYSRISTENEDFIYLSFKTYSALERLSEAKEMRKKYTSRFPLGKYKASMNDI